VADQEAGAWGDSRGGEGDLGVRDAQQHDLAAARIGAPSERAEDVPPGLAESRAERGAEAAATDDGDARARRGIVHRGSSGEVAVWVEQL